MMFDDRLSQRPQKIWTTGHFMGANPNHMNPAKEVHVHGKRSVVILFVFNMYLQQGGHRQKRLTN